MPGKKAVEIDVPENINIRTVSVWSYDEIKDDDYNGEMVIEFNQIGTGITTVFIARMPIISVWIDESNIDNPKICKAYALVDDKPFEAMEDEDKATLDDNQLERYIQAYIQAEERYNGRILAQYLYNKLKEEVYGSPVRTLTTDQRREVITFSASNMPYNPREYDNPYSIYDTKAEAMDAILSELKTTTGSQLAGQDIINKNLISDEILEELGFVQVEDKIKQGIPMWLGQTQGLFQASRDGSYTERRQRQQDMLENFLELLEIDLV